MSSKSGLRSFLRYLVLLLIVLGAAQYLVLVLHFQAAQRDLERVASVYQTAGEKRFREDVVTALRGEGFRIEPGDISIKEDPGTATVKFLLPVSQEKKVLWIPVRREAVLSAEIPYDSAL